GGFGPIRLDRPCHGRYSAITLKRPDRVGVPCTQERAGWKGEDARDEMNEPRINIPEWTVSELSAALKRTVEDAYGQVRVRGEISGFRGAHSSGHAYFALKDDSAKIDAVVWGRTFARMRIKPEEGLEVVATGRLTTYPGRSTYQIIIETLEPAGLGALM